MKKILPLVVLGLISVKSQAQHTLFWSDTETQSINVYDFDTEMSQVLKSGPGDIESDVIAIDTVHQRIFWVNATTLRMGSYLTGETETLYELPKRGNDFDIEYNYATNAVFISEFEDMVIYTYDLNTGNGSELLTASDGIGLPFTLVSSSTHLYWASANKIYRSGLDGQNVEEFTTLANNSFVYRMTIDEQNGMLYWSDQGRFGANPSIKKLDIDASGSEETVIEFESSNELVRGVTFVESQNRIHFLTRFYGIQSIQTDGTERDTVALLPDGLGQVLSLEYDEKMNTYYFSDDTPWMIESVPESSLELVFEPFAPTYLSYARASETLFYTNFNRLLALDVTSGSQTEIFDNSANTLNLSYHAVDEQDEQIFWFDLNSMYRGSFIGGTQDTLLSPGIIDGVISGIAVDGPENSIYFLDNSSTSFGSLKRAQTDGTSLDTLFFLDLDYSRGLAIDTKNGYLFWAEGSSADSARIVRSSLNGENRTRIVTATETPDLETPWQISVDEINDRIYWVDAGSGKIWTSGLDGSDPRVFNEIATDGALSVVVTSEEVTKTSTEHDNLPTEMHLSQNYPNPFNPTTTIAFGVPQTGRVRLEVFNMLGQKVSTLVDGIRTSGSYSVVFDASSLSSGVYIYRLQTGSNVLTRKLTLIK